MTAPSRYELVRAVATGGMAHVYEAVAYGAQGFQRRVAIKRILPEFAQLQAMRAMFLDEARIASRLHHGNIVQVLDYGLLDGTELLVMEYVDGMDLAQALELSVGLAPLPEGVALHIVSEIAHALGYAHALTDDRGKPYGLVHRDISPHNLLLSWDGDVKLSDFGIAIASDKTSKTQTGVVKGKPDFMAPEQLRGAPLTGAADVYGLGATLRTMVQHSASDATQALIHRCVADEVGARPAAAELAREAGGMALARLERDGRSALQDWLRSLRSSAPPVVSALDDLMGMALLRADDGRDFTVSKRRGIGGGEGADSPADGPDTGSVTLPVQSRHSWVWAAAAMLVATLVGFGWTWAGGAPARLESPPLGTAERGHAEGAPSPGASANTTAALPPAPEAPAEAPTERNATPAVVTTRQAQAARAGAGRRAVRPRRESDNPPMVDVPTPPALPQVGVATGSAQCARSSPGCDRWAASRVHPVFDRSAGGESPRADRRRCRGSLPRTSRLFARYPYARGPTGATGQLDRVPSHAIPLGRGLAYAGCTWACLQSHRSEESGLEHRLLASAS